MLQALQKIEGVEHAHSLWGVYDIIVHINAESIDKLKAIITKHIEKVVHINSKLTMIINDQTPMLQEQVIFEPAPMIQ